MLRFLAVILSLLLFLPQPIGGAPHPAAQIERSIVRIESVTMEGQTTVCTGFFVAPRKILTAYHCIHDVVIANKKPVLMVKVDQPRDLAVGLVDWPGKAVTFRQTPLTQYEQVYGVGYGFGFIYPMTTFHRALLFNFTPEMGVWPGLWISGSFAKGMSGGPVVDQHGQVVMIIQRGNSQGGDLIGYGVDAKTIQEFLKE